MVGRRPGQRFMRLLRANLMKLPRTFKDGGADDEIRLLVMPQKTPQEKKSLV